jgi:hypothetical protein
MSTAPAGLPAEVHRKFSICTLLNWPPVLPESNGRAVLGTDRSQVEVDGLLR